MQPSDEITEEIRSLPLKRKHTIGVFISSWTSSSTLEVRDWINNEMKNKRWTKNETNILVLNQTSIDLQLDYEVLYPTMPDYKISRMIEDPLRNLIYKLNVLWKTEIQICYPKSEYC
jgi:hypothetical protein